MRVEMAKAIQEKVALKARKNALKLSYEEKKNAPQTSGKRKQNQTRRRRGKSEAMRDLLEVSSRYTGFNRVVTRSGK